MDKQDTRIKNISIHYQFECFPEDKFDGTHRVQTQVFFNGKRFGTEQIVLNAALIRESWIDMWVRRTADQLKDCLDQALVKRDE